MEKKSKDIALKEEDLSVIRGSVLFRGLTDQEITAILPCLTSRKRRFEKGEPIYRTGDRIRSIALLTAGSAHIERYDYWGGRHIVSAVLPGDIFGESYAASGPGIINVDVSADTRSTVLFFDLAKVLRLCSSACPFHARLIDNLVSVLATRNVRLNEKLTCVTQHTLRDKLLAYLSAEARRQKSDRFDIPFNRQELADYLNAERSALSNELSKLRKEGVLDCQKNHFHLFRPEACFPGT